MKTSIRLREEFVDGVRTSARYIIQLDQAENFGSEEIRLNFREAEQLRDALIEKLK